ncbi:hypothetical protein BDI4_290037 [Burkholderia diffusa]|nr:hypothetical protein BDI4_290037 [Burkholderia diffusa]
MVSYRPRPWLGYLDMASVLQMLWFPRGRIHCVLRCDEDLAIEERGR